MDGDKLADIVYGMGHDFGLHWLKQSLDGKGEPELITGKRVYAHEVEPGDTQASVVFAYQYDRSAGKWLKETIFRGEAAVNAPPKAQDRWALKDFRRGTPVPALQMAAIDIDQDGDIDLVCPGRWDCISSKTAVDNRFSSFSLRKCVW